MGMQAKVEEKGDKKVQPLVASNDAGQAQGAGAHQVALTAQEFTLLNSLEHVTGSVDRTRFDIAETLTDEVTLSTLETYRPLFETVGIDVALAIETLRAAIELKQLEQRLAQAQTLVHRKFAVTLSPITSVASDVHRFVAGLPEGSPLHAAFATFEERWQQIFGKGGRPAKQPTPPSADASAPANDPKTPR